MKINKKGFTLIELLAVIGVLGLVLAISTYFIINSITGSKEKAFELSKKGLLDSAITYANEFNEEEDWVDAYPKEYTCVNAWWLVNKGMQKKEIFTEDSNEKYKFKKSDVIVLYRDNVNKVIKDAVYNEENITGKKCKNTLSSEISLSSTVNTITINGTCRVKSEVPDDIKYNYSLYDKDGKLLRDAKDKGSTYTFENLINNTNYKVKLTCHSDEFGDASSSEETSTTKLNAPIIRCNDTNAEVDFNNRSINNLVKEIKVNDALYNGTIYNVTHVNIINFATDQRPDTVKIEASVKADDNNVKSTTKNCEKPKTTIEVLPPYFETSDDITSGNWHTKTFNLLILSNNTVDVDYYYGTDQNNLEKYTNQITVNSNEITYYAKACSKNDSSVCSEISTYVAKIDNIPPEITITLYNTSNGNNITSDNYSFEKNTSLPWLPYNVSIRYDFSDAETGIDTTTAQFKYNYEFQKELDDTVELVNDNISLGRYVTSYNRSIGLDGDRKVYFKICDKAGNCSDKYTYFRTDAQKPTIYIDNNGSNINNNTIRFRCETLSGIKDSVMYQDGIERYGFVSKDYKTPYQTPSNGTITHPYNDASIYVSCTNKAGNCSKVKAKIDTDNQITNCQLMYGTMPYTNGFSDSNPCNTLQRRCGYPLYFGCYVKNGLIHYKTYGSSNTTSKNVILEEQPSC